MRFLGDPLIPASITEIIAGNTRIHFALKRGKGANTLFAETLHITKNVIIERKNPYATRKVERAVDYFPKWSLYEIQ